MRNFHIPFDMHTEDKIIGGYLSLRQFAWLLCCGFAAVWLTLVNKGYIRKDNSINVLSLSIRIIIALALIALGVYLAFFKIDELEADKYWFKKIMWKSKNNIIKYTDKK